MSLKRTRVCQNKTNLSRVDSGGIGHSEDGDLTYHIRDATLRYGPSCTYDKCHDAAQEVQTNGQPSERSMSPQKRGDVLQENTPLVGDGYECSAIFEVDVVFVVAEETIDLAVASNRRKAREGLGKMRVKKRAKHIVCGQGHVSST